MRSRRAGTAGNPAFNRPAVPGLLEAVQASQAQNHMVNAVLARLEPDADACAVAKDIRRWKRLTAIIIVTHDEKIIPTFKRIYHIPLGRTYEEAGEGRPV